ncbi:hypothetical protein OH491_07370 [Termitidicoccus mucosus]|uniref:Uncharacterized protein n=1 Tax=Termitidicoccus mucosus TaxID=1184151 RepID=A0A178IPN1_9BACT|nr:hypothetical protein AW736_26550 [Opitutaceae bacterium TSB47]
MCITLLALLVTPGFAGDASPRTPVVKQLPLDERIVYEIPISTDAPTTLMFPSAPSALEGANISNNPDAPAPVLMSHLPGRYYLSVRALTPDARATLNVILQNKTYIIRLAVAPHPYGSVTFYEDRVAGHSAALAKRATPETLLALLDRAKSHRLIREQYPEAVWQVEHCAPNDKTQYRDFTATVEEVFRFDPEDTLVFKLKLENTGDTEVVYQPQSLAVRIGNRLYPASIADASGLIPPHAETVAYFAVTGTPDGGRANLSIKNSFNVIVPRVTRDAHLIAPR